MIKLAVIGVGRMGSVHTRNIAQGRVCGAQLVALCDIDNSVTDKLKAKYPKVAIFNDYKEMLCNIEIDGVIVATPHYSHPEIVIYCLNKNVHTLVEKPIAVTTQSAKDMIAVSEQNTNTLFAIMYNQRTNRMYAKARELVHSGAIGEIVRANLIITDWYRSQAYYDQGEWRASYNGEGGGVLINQCVHQLDVLQWIIGMPTSIIANMSTVNRNITVENDVTSILKYPNYNCSFTASTHELKGTNRLEIAGTKGRIIVDKFKMTYYIHKNSEIDINNNTTKGYGFTISKKAHRRYGYIRLLRDIIIGQQVRILRNFAKAIAGKEELLSPGRDGLYGISLINGIYLSAWTNSEIAIPLDDSAYENILDIKRKEEPSN